jgi:protein phosphatase
MQLRPPHKLPLLSSAGKSDVGLRRRKNEDAFILRPEAGFFALADGMGGAAAGEVASRIFVETAAEVIMGNVAQSEKEAVAWVQRVFSSANDRIIDHVANHLHHKGMGCTAELVVAVDDHFVVGHLGDSRTYRFKNGNLKRLTEDHSLVQEQITKGLITPEEARQHPLRNVILRALGISPNPALDLVRGNLSVGDLFLICSDGLTDMLSDAVIQEILSSVGTLPQQVDRLIDMAKSAGGFDNITVVLFQVQ